MGRREEHAVKKVAGGESKMIGGGRSYGNFAACSRKFRTKAAMKRKGMRKEEEKTGEEIPIGNLPTSPRR